MVVAVAASVAVAVVVVVAAAPVAGGQFCIIISFPAEVELFA